MQKCCEDWLITNLIGQKVCRGGLALFSAMLSPEPGVDRKIYRECDGPEQDLGGPGQGFRIEKRKKEAKKKVSFVADLSGLPAQPVFKRCERTDPAGKLHEGSPSDCRQMEPHHPRPLHDKEPANEDEEDEDKVNDCYDIG